MGGLFKILLVTAPVLALIFYYVVVKQSALDVELRKESLQFERDWNEWQMSMFGKDKKYAERAEKAEKELMEIEKKEKEKQEKVEKFEKEFDKALDDFEKKQQKK